MNKVFSISIALAFFASNIIWLAFYYSKKAKDDYNLTLICEFRQLNELNTTFSKGISQEDLIKDCNNHNLVCSEAHLGFRIDYLEPCPNSGRPFCGYYPVFENNQLKKLISGYPCH